MKKLKIGIPRALLYYWYGFLWENFWDSAGFEVITSPVTDRRILMDGVNAALDELCLPVKIFLGHVMALAPSADRIMIPHLIKVEPDAYICPKFMGLPDIASHALPALKPKLFTVKVGPDHIDMLDSLNKAARRLGASGRRVDLSNRPESAEIIPALAVFNSYQRNAEIAATLTIGLLGHAYCLYDPGFNHNLLPFLIANRIRILTPEMLPPAFRGVGAAKLNKKLFWTTGRLQFDALDWFLSGNVGPIDGFISIAPFACGPEAIVSDMLERRIKQAGKPCLKINYEEHSGEAGIITRLEAFLDLIRYHHQAC